MMQGNGHFEPLTPDRQYHIKTTPPKRKAALSLPNPKSLESREERKKNEDRYSAKQAGVKRVCLNKGMAHVTHVWFMHDAHLGRAFLFLVILAEFSLLSMTITIAPCLWYVIGMKLVISYVKFPQAPLDAPLLANAERNVQAPLSERVGATFLCLHPLTSSVLRNLRAESPFHPHMNPTSNTRIQTRKHM